MARILLAALIPLLASGPALALSCLRPTVADSYAAADASDAAYLLVLGRIDLLPGQTPRSFDGRRGGEDYTLQAYLTGTQGGTDGFRRAVAFPLTLEIGCAGPWCGSVPDGKVLMFVERRGGEHVLELGACPQFALSATPEIVARASQCLADGPCAPLQ